MSKSIISGELKRNCDKRNDGKYNLAHHKTQGRKKGFSPEQIAGC